MRIGICAWFVFVVSLPWSAEALEDLHTIRRQHAQQSSSVLHARPGHAIHLFQGGHGPYTDGYSIFHIRKKDDKLTWLFSTGIKEEPTARRTFSYSFFGGIRVAGSRLWILAYHSPRFITGDYDFRPDRRELGKLLPPEPLHQGSFVLRVYDIGTGQELGRHVFHETPPEFRERISLKHENLGPGLITSATRNHAVCGNLRIKLKGKTLVAEEDSP